MIYAPKRCVQCSVEFTPNSGRQETCSDVCRKISRRLWDRSYRSRVYRTRPVRKAAALVSGKRIRDHERDTIFEAYGGYRCVCCHESEPKFLTIDHINNDGAEHRKSIGGSGKLYRWLIKNQFPSGFQVLCSNCNTGRHRNGGVCPHKMMVTHE